MRPNPGRNLPTRGNPGGGVRPGFPGGAPGRWTPPSRPGFPGGIDRSVYKNGQRQYVNPGYDQRYQWSNSRADWMRQDNRSSYAIDRCRNDWNSRYYPIFIARQDRCSYYQTQYRPRYDSWRSYGFCGGFYWDFRPVVIDSYLWNPSVYYFYSTSWDHDYYRRWYGDDYDRTPALQTPNPYVGYFYPTQEFIDLTISVGGMAVDDQVGYRQSLSVLIQRLQNELNLGGMFAQLGAQDVVINHFQTLPYDNAVVVEGYVANDARQFAFKAYLDLDEPSNTLVFVPTSTGGQPTYEQLAQLQQINSLITEQGGVVETGNE